MESRTSGHLAIHLVHPWPLMDCSLESISNYFKQATFKWLRWKGFLQLPLGEEFSAVWYTSLFWTGWLVRKFPLKFICFVIFHQEPAIWGRIRLPHAGFLFYLFQCESLFPKVSIRLLDITACCIHSIQAQGPQVKPPGEGLAVAIRNDCYRTWGILLAGPPWYLPPPTVRADPFRYPLPHTQKWNLIINYSFYST